MKDIAQTIAQDAYKGDIKGIIGALMLLRAFSMAVFLFVVWFKERVKK